MNAVLDEQERARIVELSRRYLARHQPKDYELRVVVDSIHQEGDWYYVVVEPSRNDIYSYDYSSRLAEAELDLQDQEKINVLFVPALGE